MSIHKKSVISSLKTTKKANIAKESPSFAATVTSGKKSPVLVKPSMVKGAFKADRKMAPAKKTGQDS